jgi:hypothetical protein
MVGSAFQPIVENARKSRIQSALTAQGVPSSQLPGMTNQIQATNQTPQAHSPVAQRLGPMSGEYGRPQTQQPNSNPRALMGGIPTDMPPGRPQGSDFAQSPMVAPRSPGVPGLATGASEIRAPRMAPGMDVPGSIVTPEGILADRIAGMSMQPDPAEVAAQIGAARAMGEQRFNDSDVGSMLLGRTADAARRFQPQRIDPTGIGAREDAIAAALEGREQGPALDERIANSRAGMQGMVAQALQAQGGQMNPQVGFEQNARMLQPGTTLRGTSADGTPMIVSRGSAGTRDDRTRLAQQETNRRIRQEQSDRRGNANQMRAARSMAVQEAANNPMNSPVFRQLMMTDPRGAAAMMQAQGNMQIGQAEVAQRGEAAARQFQLETERLKQTGVIGEAEAAERNARAEASLAEASAIRDALTPEGQDRAMRNRIVQGAAETGTLPPTANRQVNNEISRLFGGQGGQGGVATALPPLAPAFGQTEITDTEISNRITELNALNMAPTEIEAELRNYGIPESRIKEYQERQKQGPTEKFGQAVIDGGASVAKEKAGSMRAMGDLVRWMTGR